MMVLGTEYPMDWVYDHPPEARAALLAGSPAFDYRNAPVLAEVGWLAEAFRRRPGTMVSDNPSGRFGARGAAAEALMADQPWHDYYGPGSPLEKLCRWGGRILRLGANPDTVTALHLCRISGRPAGQEAGALGLCVAGRGRRAAPCLDRLPRRSRRHRRLGRRGLFRLDPRGLSGARPASRGAGRQGAERADRRRRHRRVRRPLDGGESRPERGRDEKAAPARGTTGAALR